MSERAHKNDVTRPVWLRLLIGLVVALVAIELIWVVGANWALSSGFVADKINKRPAKLRVEWESARTWVPGRIEIEGLSLRSQSKKQQIYGSLDRVAIQVGLTPLLQKTVKVLTLRGSGVDFRMRKRQQPDTAPEPAAQFDPEIPGLTADDAIPPKKKKKKAKNGPKKPWRLVFDDVRLTDIQQIWIQAYHLTGHGEIAARLSVETKGGEIAVDHARVTLGDVEINAMGQRAAHGMKIDLEGSLEPFRSKEVKGRGVLGLVSASLDISGQTTSVGLVNTLLADIETVSAGSAGGQVDGTLRLDHGELADGTQFSIEAPEGWVDMSEWRAKGALAVRTEVRTVNDQLVTTANLDMDPLEVSIKGLDAPLLAGASLQLAVEAGAVDLSGNAGRIAESLEMASLDLVGAEVVDITHFPVPEVGDFSLLSGSIRMETHVLLSRDGSQAQVDINGLGLGATYGDVTMTGDLAIDIDVETSDLKGKDFIFKKGAINIDNVRVADAEKAKTDQKDWYLHLNLDQGQARLSDPGLVTTVVRIRMQNTRPLVAIMGEEQEVVSKLEGILDFEDVDGTADLRMNEQVTELTDIALDSEGLKILANLRLGDADSTGIVFVKFHGIPLSVDLRGEKPRLKIFGPRAWYDKQTDPWNPPPEKDDEPEATVAPGAVLDGNVSPDNDES